MGRGNCNYNKHFQGMDDQNDSVPSPQVLLFFHSDQHTVNFTIPIFKTFNSKPNFPSSQPPRHPHPHTATSSRYTVAVGTCRGDRHLREPDTCPKDSPRNLSTSPSPFPSCFVHLPLGDAEISAGAPVSPYSSFPLPQRHCLSFVSLRPTGHHHRRVRCVQR